MAIALKKSRASRNVNGDGKLPPDTQLITAIDVGTTKVCAIVGRRGDAGGLEVLAHSTVPCDGLRKGNVYDVAVTGSAVRAAIQEVDEATGLRVESAFVGITGDNGGQFGRSTGSQFVERRHYIVAARLGRLMAALALGLKDRTILLVKADLCRGRVSFFVPFIAERCT